MASENLENFSRKAARKHFKIKRLSKGQNAMINDLCKKVVIAKKIDDWESAAEACIKDNKNILKLDLPKEIEEAGELHKLTDYTAAIVYHSENFSN